MTAPSEPQESALDQMFRALDPALVASTFTTFRTIFQAVDRIDGPTDEQLGALTRAAMQEWIDAYIRRGLDGHRPVSP